MSHKAKLVALPEIDGAVIYVNPKRILAIERKKGEVNIQMNIPGLKYKWNGKDADEVMIKLGLEGGLEPAKLIRKGPKLSDAHHTPEEIAKALDYQSFSGKTCVATNPEIADHCCKHGSEPCDTGGPEFYGCCVHGVIEKAQDDPHAE